VDGWMDNILPIRIRTEDHGSESVLHYWRCVRLCRWNKLPNPNLQIPKSPMPWHALTLACHIRMIGTSASCLVTSLDSSSNNANRFASPRLNVASFAMQHDWSSVSLAPRLYHYHYGPRASYLGSSFLSAVH